MSSYLQAGVAALAAANLSTAAAEGAGADAPTMDHGAMAGMQHGSMHGGEAPADARDPHAYAEGADFGAIPRPRLSDEHRFGSLLVDRLESVRSRDENGVGYDLQGWYGRDYDRLVVKAEGEAVDGRLQEGRTELLWGHAIASYWDAQLGVRYDSGLGPDRGWLAFGVQGLAPYWFEVEAFAYVGQSGRTALRFDAEYELLLTQKLILQPRIEANLYGRRDEALGIGSGLSEVAAGLRLRYEFTRQFGPYVGFEWAGKFGETADLARVEGERTKTPRVVAGVRMWF
ncbi:MAG TPA: copper resistance protein B [Rhodocyclaceae bacterium]|nr:copper resistance protein B [Rhodocyclaceae bacterium]